MAKRRKPRSKDGVFGRHKSNPKGSRAKRFERKHYAPCVECGGMGEPVMGEVIYPHRPDLWPAIYYLCKCGAYVGSHRRGGHPLGYPAGSDTRRARVAAHAAFDPIWKLGLLPSRDAAYEWLSTVTGIPPMRCHISKLNAAEVKQVTRLSLDHWNEHATEEQKAAKEKGTFPNRSETLKRLEEKAVKEANEAINGSRKTTHGAGSKAAVSDMLATGDGASCDRVCRSHGQGGA